MNLTPNRLAILEELYYEGPFHHPGDWRAFNSLFKAGYVEANLLELADAIAAGYKPKGDEPQDDEYLFWSSEAVWRISASGRKALEAYYETGVVFCNPLATMTCQGTA